MMTEGSELRKKLNLQTEESKLEDRQSEMVTQSLVSFFPNVSSKYNSDPLEY